MAWSYRQDCSDESYHEPGVALIEGEKLPDTPASAEHAKDLLEPERVEKREKEEQKKKESEAKNGKTKSPEQQAQEQFSLNQKRNQMRVEERARLQQEEADKEDEKMRKEEAENAKKEMANDKKSEHQPAHANK
jgi:hypothetical protein